MTPSRRAMLIATVLLAMTAAVYWQTRDHPFFLLDDAEYVPGNPVVLQGLTARGVAWAFTSFHAANWHPLTWLSHMADVALFGPDAGWHHLVNVLFHGLNAVLLFLVLQGMTGAPWRSAFVAALFAAHPLHVESVAWVAERKDLLCAFFGLLTIGAYAHYARKPAVGRYVVVLFLYALCLLSKPMLVTLPFLLVLLDYWPLGRMFPADRPGGAPAPGWFLRTVPDKIPLLLLSAASCVVTVLAQQSEGAVTSLTRIPPGLRAGNAAVSYVSYLARAVWPSPLAVYYPFPAGGIPAWKVAGAVALLAGATLTVVLARKDRPWLVTGWLWYLGTLVPVIGLVQLGEQAMADRYTYLPLIGPFLAIAWEGGEALPAWRFRRQALGIAAGAVLAALSVAAWTQAGAWRNSATLARQALSATRDNWMAWNVLGISKGREGRHAEAVDCFLEGLRIDPGMPELWRNLGIAYGFRGDAARAIDALRQAVRRNPDYEDAWLRMGRLHAASGRFGDAAGAFREAVRIRPADAAAWTDLGNAYDDLGRPGDAIASYRQALRADPGLVAAWQNLGIALARIGNREEAMAVYVRLRRIAPEEARGLLARIESGG